MIEGTLIGRLFTLSIWKFDQRRGGVHFTPRSLSGPIVARTLDPLIKVMGEEPASERLLNLKICDPAMGSGAFLVEACRYLGDQVVAAWTREGRLDKIVDEREDVVNHARRLVAQRCLYGVDKNRFAVNLAKLSLWLVTLAKDEPFTFVDHALRHGDSLVGLDFEQIRSFHWKANGTVPACQAALEAALDEAVALREQILDLAANGDVASTREKYRLLQDAEDALKPVRLIGDLVVGAFFTGTKDKERDQELNRRLELVEAWLQAEERPTSEMEAMQQEIRKRLPVFHWMAEFPEIFHSERADPLDNDQVNRAAWVDGFIGNPPYAGNTSIIQTHGQTYSDYLKETVEGDRGSRGNCDLSAFFLRLSHRFLGEHGTLGFITTNTIAQGDTRSIGLRHLLAHGNTGIYNATRTISWPGEAAVCISVVHLAAGNVRRASACHLDNQKVTAIDSRLRPKPERPDPVGLGANRTLSFLGSKIYGNGFLLSIEERDRLVAVSPKNDECIFPYIGGEEVNTSPTQEFNRCVINFGERPISEAEFWPDLIDIVRREVKPQRERLSGASSTAAIRKRDWWLFSNRAPALYAAIRAFPRCLVNSQVSKHLMFSFQPTDRVFSHKLFVFPFKDHTQFAILQSRVHLPWARLLSSTLEERLNYSASDCFDTFPFPEPDPRTIIPAVEAIGEKLYTARANYMVENDVGLTTTYNRLKDPTCTEAPIETLRELHLAMDQAVLEAYGWGDIKPPPFTTPQTPAEEKALEAFKDEVIDRLFVLNAERAKAEAIDRP